jgi:hypothetical protein
VHIPQSLAELLRRDGATCVGGVVSPVLPNIYLHRLDAPRPGGCECSDAGRVAREESLVSELDDDSL